MPSFLSGETPLRADNGHLPVQLWDAVDPIDNLVHVDFDCRCREQQSVTLWAGPTQVLWNDGRNRARGMLVAQMNDQFELVDMPISF